MTHLEVLELQQLVQRKESLSLALLLMIACRDETSDLLSRDRLTYSIKTVDSIRADVQKQIDNFHKEKL